MEFEVTLPKLGESILSATIVKWFKKEGDEVVLDEPLLEVSTDKVNSEIPSPAAGVLVKIMAQPDEELDVGAPLAILSTDKAAAPVQQENTIQKQVTSCEELSTFLSPAVLSFARENNIPISELEKLKGTGRGNRLSKKDVEMHLTNRPTSRIDRIKMSGMRKAIAENMVKSFYEAPHASLIIDADVTALMKKIKEEKEVHGFKLTITPFIVKAIAEAISEFPFLNASLDGDTILVKKHINVGIAVSVNQGLLVPVVRDCQDRETLDIAKEVAEIANQARNATISPDAVKEGTITMTNFGMSGTLMGTPIIRHPEVAIIGVGAIHKRVVALEDDTAGVRQMVYLSLTFDHRVLDGMYGCGFLGSLKNHLENPGSPPNA